MARIRTIKPDFFMSDDIGDLTVMSRLLYVALWTHADRRGIIRYQRTALMVQCMPFEMDQFDGCMAELIGKRQIEEYEVQGKKYLYLPTFTKHQRPHHTEKDSDDPAPESLNNGDLTDKSPLDNAQEGKGREKERKGKEAEEEGKGREGGYKGEGEESLNGSSSRRRECPHQEIIDLYHAKLPDLQRVVTLTPEQEAELDKRWANGMGKMENWEAYFDDVQHSPFLMGKKGKFKAGFNFLIQKRTIDKMQRGEYFD